MDMHHHLLVRAAHPPARCLLAMEFSSCGYKAYGMAKQQRVWPAPHADLRPAICGHRPFQSPHFDIPSPSLPMPARRVPKKSTARSGTASAPTGDSEQHEPHIPRPCNAFILYRKDKVHEIRGAGHQVDASKQIGALWNAESEEVKRYYARLADEAKLEHQRRYPDYRYTPRTKKGKSRGGTVAPETGKKKAPGPSSKWEREGSSASSSVSPSMVTLTLPAETSPSVGAMSPIFVPFPFFHVPSQNIGAGASTSSAPWPMRTELARHGTSSVRRLATRDPSSSLLLEEQELLLLASSVAPCLDPGEESTRGPCFTPLYSDWLPPMPPSHRADQNDFQ
ncbi:hypothetical protein C8Q77DRAFT_1073467 [Trametes polyzona]|nr:hypothetical protein C8Q77DRAFT_1073467 [Trametes polyzona]